MAAQAKVFIVDRESNADYKVFFVDRESDERNAQIVAGGKLVNRDSEADVKVFIVDRESNSNIKIMRRHFPR